VAIKSVIEGSEGNKLHVGPEGEINVAMHTHPVRDEAQIGFPYSDFFTDDGGSNDMVVATDTDFCIRAVSEFDLYIGSLHVLLADAGAAFNEFGNLPALTNGCSLKWVSREFGEKEILSGIKENLDFYRMTEQEPKIIDLSGGGADAISCFINLRDLFLLPFGVRLRRGTDEKLTFSIRDNLTGISNFNIRANGMEF
jgi:hypothetical protein